MHAPQIIILVLMAIDLLWIANQHGLEKEGEYNIFVSLVSAAIYTGLLYWGGFFN